MSGNKSNENGSKRDVPDVPLDQIPSSDDASKMEAAGFDNASLEKDAKRRSHNRREGSKDHVYYAGLFLLWLIVVVVFLGITLWGYHLLTPASIHFLDNEQIDRLENLVASAAVATLVSEYLRKLR